MNRPKCPRCGGWLLFDGADLDCLICGSLYWGDKTPDGMLFRIADELWLLRRPEPRWPTGVGGSNLSRLGPRTVAPG